MKWTENSWQFLNMHCLLQISIGGMMRTELAASRCFDSFSSTLGKSSRVILNKSPINLISLIFTFTTQKIALMIFQQRSILKVQKPVGVLSYNSNCPFLPKHFNSIWWPTLCKLPLLPDLYRHYRYPSDSACRILNSVNMTLKTKDQFVCLRDTDLKTSLVLWRVTLLRSTTRMKPFLVSCSR